MDKKELSFRINESAKKCKKEMLTSLHQYIKEQKFLSMKNFVFLGRRGRLTCGEIIYWNNGLKDAVLIDNDGVCYSLKKEPLNFLLMIKDGIELGKITRMA